VDLHRLLPLIAFILNVSLAGIAVIRNPASRLNRLFAYFVSAMAVWNFGVFMLRHAPDPASAFFWEVVIHVGVIAIPALYYHFVLIFVDKSTRHRPALLISYALALTFTVINMTTSPLFLRGVEPSVWGWVPATGPLYTAFFLYVNALLIMGLWQLMRAARHVASSFRRNRLRLVQIGTLVTLAGGFVDFIRFILARSFPVLEQMYPVGIPANMIFALLLGTSIVRYRLFDVTVAAKKTALYAALAVVLTSLLAVLTRAIEQSFGLGEIGTLWVAIPMGFVMSLLVSPLGRPLEDRVQQLMFSRRRGCYQTLLDLSKRMGAMLDSGTLTETLVRELVDGIPLSHCALLIYDRGQKLHAPVREASTIDIRRPAAAISAESAVARWLTDSGEVLVKEEAKVNPRIAQYFASVEADLEEIDASLIVPLKADKALIGILLLGEKLSGEIFDGQELEVLSVLANQAAISLENSRLYEELRAALKTLEESQQRVIQGERLRALGEMAGGVAHDFNNILAAIILRAQILLESAMDPELRRQLQVIETAAEDGAQTVRRIQEFSRMRRARPFQAVNLNHVVTEVVEMTRSRWQDEAHARGVAYDIRMETTPLPAIAGDPSELREALMNLVFNAIDAMPTGGRLTIRTAIVAGQVFCVVADTGIGMPEDVRQRVFEPFFTTKEEKGTGLGLSVVYGILTRHGGQIEVHSQVGQGSEFVIRLPMGGEMSSDAGPSPGSDHETKGKARILVIDDEMRVREALHDLLAGRGHTVVTCGDGKSGLARLEEQPFDLLITDLGMPGMSGWDVAKRAKARSPETPVALITGWGDQIDPAEARVKGIDFLVAKPLEIDDVMRIVVQALAKKIAPSTFGDPHSVASPVHLATSTR
jgi:signal transduction histidine kinase/ActR/RegA family two-component response regulator